MVLWRSCESPCSVKTIRSGLFLCRKWSVHSILLKSLFMFWCAIFTFCILFLCLAGYNSLFCRSFYYIVILEVFMFSYFMLLNVLIRCWFILCFLLEEAGLVLPMSWSGVCPSWDKVLWFSFWFKSVMVSSLVSLGAAQGRWCCGFLMRFIVFSVVDLLVVLSCGDI